MSVYPTLCDLAGIAKPAWAEGDNIKPLLADPAAKWDHAAITTYGRNNHAIRTDRWRYIRYADGGEELYDHNNDEYEWSNLAAKSEHAALKAELAARLPRTNAPEMEGKGKGGDGEGKPAVSEDVKARRKARRGAKAADQSQPTKP